MPESRDSTQPFWLRLSALEFIGDGALPGVDDAVGEPHHGPLSGKRRRTRGRTVLMAKLAYFNPFHNY